MNAPLLTTKLFAPRLRRKFVPRPRLTGRLDMGLQRKLTLISAPAGFGKTTLAAEWLNATPHPVTWFSLDETDNDPARFLTYFVAALQKVNPAIGTATQAMLQAPQPPAPEVLLTALLNDITTTPTPFVLVIDDYHVSQTLAIHQHLIFLLDHLPSQMHIVLISREDPPFPLSRLRARGQMTDLRQADLRFTEEETRDFAQHVMQVALSTDDITTLHACTEGWAGLRPALAYAGRRDVQLRQYLLRHAVGRIAPRTGGRHPRHRAYFHCVEVLIAALAKSVSKANNLGIIVGIVMSALGGAIGGKAPMTRMEGFGGILASLTPQGHAVNAYYSVISENATLVQVLPSLGILMAMCIAFYAIAVWRFKFEV